jgi:DNA-binding CsgD family transcriptional regulator
MEGLVATMSGTDLYKTIVDSISAHVAILDGEGHIVETNRAWQEYGRDNGMPNTYRFLGVNYLAICEQSSKQPEDEAGQVAEGIRRVLSGEISEFLTQYPCHSPQQKRWYAVRVVPYRGDDRKRRVIVAHEDITPFIEAQEQLQAKEAELRRQQERLEETNIALRVLLRQREEDKKRIEETISGNVDRLVLPYLEKLQQGQLTEKQRTLVEVMDTNLRDIVSPFLRSLASLQLMLTPQEIEVASMVRTGKASKEIAVALGLSVAGVDFHRKGIRKKLGLANTRQNLRSYLLSLE